MITTPEHLIILTFASMSVNQNVLALAMFILFMSSDLRTILILWLLCLTVGHGEGTTKCSD